MKKKIINLLILGLILIIYLILGKIFNFYLFCPIYKFTGFYCPGCGTTRMFLSILKGEFYQAFRYNPLVFIIIPVFLVYYLGNINNKDWFKKLEPKIYYILIIIFIIYGVLRNIFSFLKPL